MLGVSYTSDHKEILRKAIDRDLLKELEFVRII